MKGAIEKALEENKAKFDHLVDTEKMPDAINDFSVKTVASALKPLLARRPKYDEQWGDEKPPTSIEAPKQRRDESEDKKRRSVDHERGEPRAKAQGERLTERIRRLSISLRLARTRHEKDRKRILGEAAGGTRDWSKKKESCQKTRFDNVLRKGLKISSNPSTSVDAMDCESFQQ